MVNDFSRGYLVYSSKVAVIRWLQQPIMGLGVPIPRKTIYKDTGGPFYLDQQEKRPDLFSDDPALWLQTGRRPFVCARCYHTGLLNTLIYIRLLNKSQRVRTLIDVFYLRNSSPDRLVQTMWFLATAPADLSALRGSQQPGKHIFDSAFV